MTMPRVAVAIPAYNEADGIAEFLREIDEALAPVCDLALVVVDDHSTDRTADVLAEVAERLSCDLRVHRMSRNAGHGPTMLEAYRLALETRPTYVLAVDGDGQFFGSDLRRILALLEDGGAGACGVRRARVDPWVRIAISRLLRAYLAVAFSATARDANSPLRGYRADLLDDLLEWVPHESLVPNLHLAILAERRGTPLIDVDVSHRVRRGTVARGTMFTRATTAQSLRRLAGFSLAALAESFRFRHHLNRQDRPVPNAKTGRDRKSGPQK